MTRQHDRATMFNALHLKGRPVVLFNVWDAGTAMAVARAGARALATGSWSVAEAHGFRDGETLPRELALANLRRIAGAVDLPVTVDLESGYGGSPDAVAETVTRAIEAGAIGFNLEDQIIGQTGLYAVAEQAARVHAARAAVDRTGIPAYVNARTDLFLKAEPADHDDKLLDAALQRADAYRAVGASGFFAPGLVDDGLIGRLCAACALPVNILMRPGAPPTQRLAALGVARVSFGPAPYRLAMRVIEDAAREALSGT